VLNQGHEQKRELEAELKAKFPTMWEKATYYCPGVTQRNRYPHLVSDLDMHVDHKVPVTWHWNEIGRKRGQQERQEWYVCKDNLQALCGKCNTSKGSLDVDFDPQTEDGFIPPANFLARPRK
jgi:hypothetical protein